MSMQQRQQIIRSLLQNFDWETDPHWKVKLRYIESKIHEYWDIDLKREHKE